MHSSSNLNLNREGESSSVLLFCPLFPFSSCSLSLPLLVLFLFLFSSSSCSLPLLVLFLFLFSSSSCSLPLLVLILKPSDTPSSRSLKSRNPAVSQQFWVLFWRGESSW